MTRDECIAIIAALTANWWQGKDMTDATAALYLERLQPLDFETTMSVVLEMIDSSPQRTAPTIGQIREAVRIRGLPERHQTPALPTGVRRIGEPWFVKLQYARQKRGRPAGIPLRELHDGEDDNLRRECAQYGITDVDLDYWREASKGRV